MSKIIVLLSILVAVHCGLLNNLLEEKKGLDSSLNNGITTLDKGSEPVVNGLTGLLGVKQENPKNTADEQGKAETTTVKDGTTEVPTSEATTKVIETTSPKVANATESKTESTKAKQE